MEYILKVFISCLTVMSIAWAIVHCNGRIIISTIDLLTNKKWLLIATEREVILIGIVPLAIASLVGTADGNCSRSFPIFLITEGIILGLFIVNYLLNKKRDILFNNNFFSSNKIVFVLGIGWCLLFSLWSWSTLDAAANFNADRLLLNGNADMWLYTRRFSAFISDKVSFNNFPACDYLQASPKKLSSFIGSILVALTPQTSLAITLFQGLLGGSLFLSLFGSWHNFSYRSKSLSKKGTTLAIVWGITSPTIFWLIISSYASNLLFITIFVLGLTSARHLSLNRDQYPDRTEFILLFAFIICIFSFYLILLPIALAFYLATLIIYQAERYFNPRKNLKNWAKLFLAAGIIILLCLLLFPHQINLNEVSNNLNLTRGHGKNFVPLNPWSLLQERLNPMPVTRDFGVWFNMSIGAIASGFLLKIVTGKLTQLKSQNLTRTYYQKDLIAASLAILAYIAYLFAYIPLDYTYRLGKFAISIIYPLAILGLLPATLWYRDRFYKSQSSTVKLIYSVLIVLHIILHLTKMELSAKPMGNYQITSPLDEIDSLTLVKCQQTDSSQKYQKLVGIQLAKKYPQLEINIISEDNALSNAPDTDLVVYGQDRQGKDDNVCLFEINNR